MADQIIVHTAAAHTYTICGMKWQGNDGIHHKNTI